MAGSAFATGLATRWATTKRRWHVVALVGLYLAMLAGLVIFNWITHAPVRGASCPATTTTAAGAASPPSKKRLATLSLREGQSNAIQFSRSFGLRRRALEFDVTDPDKVVPVSGDLAVSVGTFLHPPTRPQVAPPAGRAPSARPYSASGCSAAPGSWPSGPAWVRPSSPSPPGT